MDVRVLPADWLHEIKFDGYRLRLEAVHRLPSSTVNNRDSGPNPRIATLHCAIVSTPDSQEKRETTHG
jgi:hypothetical protein